MDQKQIKDLKAGDNVLAFFILRKKEKKQRKNASDEYLSMEFGDSSGRIQGSLWNDVARTSAGIRVGDVVKVKGKVIHYLEKPHITVEKIRKATKKDEVSPEQFLPVTAKDTGELINELKNELAVVDNDAIKTLLQLFFNDKRFLEEFKKAPGGKLWHHAYLGGLLEHTLSVVRIANFFAGHYQGWVDRNVLLAAAFLHDIGKIDEFSTQGFIDYSTGGRLLGHINLGFKKVTDKIEQIKDFPEDLKQRILHCILSHHGTKEKGAPVVPMTIEALMLNYADETDSTTGAFQRIISKEKEPGKVWSQYVNLIDRFIYFGE